MASAAISGFATLLKIGDGGTSEAFTTIAEVGDISGPGMSMEPIEVTNMSSTAAWKEYIAGLLDAGELSFAVNFIPTTATQSQTSGLLKDFKNRTKRNFQLVFPDTGATTWTFSAFVTGFEPSMPVEDKMSADVTLKITGSLGLTG